MPSLSSHCLVALARLGQQVRANLVEREEVLVGWDDLDALLEQRRCLVALARLGQQVRANLVEREEVLVGRDDLDALLEQRYCLVALACARENFGAELVERCGYVKDRQRPKPAANDCDRSVCAFCVALEVGQ